MYFISLILMAFALLDEFIQVVGSGSGGIIFFGVVTILICCGGCLICHRILYELVMAFLQLPKLIAAMERLANTVDKSNNDGPGVPVMVSNTPYQKSVNHEHTV